MKKAVVLLSGGIDSTTCLFLAKKKGYKCFSLIFDYGQRHKREIESARKVSKASGSRHTLLKIKFPWEGSALLNKHLKVPSKRTKGIPNTYVPARNTIFLSYALSFAEAVGATAIFIGAHSQDYSGYPDCRREYFDAFIRMKNLGTKLGRTINIITPLVNKTKRDIIRLGNRLKVPYHLTWSCYNGFKRPCGKCDSCYYRIQGFKEVGIKDPLL